MKFKRYELEQLQLLPASLDELISGKHLVRVINEIIEKMQLEAIESGHMEQLRKNINRLLATWVADAGYGNKENYLLLESEKVEAYLKYPGFDREKQKRARLSEKEKHQSAHLYLSLRKATKATAFGTGS